MHTNPYARNPLWVAQVDPATGAHVRAFVFLGGVPRTVLDAARRGSRAATRANPRTPVWSAADGKILAAYYGAKWRELLTPSDPPAASSKEHGLQSLWTMVGGSTAGGASAFGDLSELDRLPQPTRDLPEGLPKEQFDIYSEEPAGAPSLEPMRGQAGAAPPVYSDIAVYPEDTIFDLRLKLSAASDVPVWRAHLFYYVSLGDSALSLEGPMIPYKITLDGLPVNVDWRAMAYGEKGPSVAGIAVDPLLEERKDSLRVEALDTFTQLAPAPTDSSALALVRIARVYYVDLALFIESAPQSALNAALRDRYQFDLLYYGAVIRYWPQLSPDACSRAFGKSVALEQTYPDLAPDPASLRDRFLLERKLADAAIAWRVPSEGRRAPIAVTSASLRVLPTGALMRVAIRNVFDWIPTGASVLAAKVRFDAAEAPIIAVKRHISSYIGALANFVSDFVEKQPRRDGASFALSRQDQLAVLTVGSDGRYEIAADWREDDRTGFEEVRQELQRTAEPLLLLINRMRAAAFPIGGALRVLTPPAGAMASAPPAGTTLGGITASAFWPHALSAAAFRELKARLLTLERAGITRARGLQLAGTYQFAFLRGIVAYDRRSISSVDRRGADRINYNQYSWLTDEDSAVRWAAAFPGRTVRLYHRATDLRIEIMRADNLAEFELIRRYLFAFLDSIRDIVHIVAAKTTDAEEPRRLRRLQERDPQLFDLKRYGNADATVYSVLCQAGRQPHIYNEEEAGALSAKARAKLSPYWNFTESAPAFYECPHSQYPHLSFRSGVHPLGYCLPCCKKARAAPTSRAAAMNAACINSALARAGKSSARASEADDLPARHILAYGKALAPGRLGELPREVSGGLFLDALPEKRSSLLAVGVPQSALSSPNAGFAYALAQACAGGYNQADPARAMTIDAALEALAVTAVNLGDNYLTLGDAAAEFASAAALAEAIRATFIRQDSSPGPFSPGGRAADNWPDLLIALVQLTFSADPVILFDAGGAGVVSLEATAGAAASIRAQKSPIMLISVSPAGAYPAAIIGGQRRHPARLNTTLAADLLRDAQWFFEPKEKIATAVAAALASAKEIRNAPSLMGAAAVSQFCARPQSAWAVDTRLANLRGEVYAVILRGAKGRAYIPVTYSPVIADGTPVLFGPLPVMPLPTAALDAAIGDLNTYIATADSCRPFTTRTEGRPVVDADGAVIGYADSTDGPISTDGPTKTDGTTRLDRPGEHIYYYHDPSSQTGGQPIDFPYDHIKIDQAIADKRRGKDSATAEAAEVVALAAAASAQHRIYPLLLSEFSALLAAERNTELRGQISQAITETRFSDAASTLRLRVQLSTLLEPWPGDEAAIRNALARAYTEATGVTSQINSAANEIIAATKFAFDRLTIARLQRLGSHAETAAAIRSLLQPRVAAAVAVAESLNMYVSCAEPTSLPQPQCAQEKNRSASGARLAVPEAELEGFYDCLAADVRNPSKSALLSAASAGVIDPTEFIQRDGERLFVRTVQLVAPF